MTTTTTATYTMSEVKNGVRIEDTTVTAQFVQNYSSPETRAFFESLGGTETYRKRNGVITVTSSSPDGALNRKVVFTPAD